MKTSQSHVSKPEVTRAKVYLELWWWLLTLIVCAIVLFPILRSIPEYPFLVSNVLFVVIFITVTRYIFLLKHTFLAHLTWIKAGIIAFSAIILFLLITGLGDFNSFVDEQGLQVLVTNLSFEKQTALISYMHNEMIFFGVGSIIATALLPVRMLISLWRMRNRGTV